MSWQRGSDATSGQMMSRTYGLYREGSAPSYFFKVLGVRSLAQIVMKAPHPRLSTVILFPQVRLLFQAMMHPTVYTDDSYVQQSSISNTR